MSDVLVGTSSQKKDSTSIFCRCLEPGLRLGDWVTAWWLPEVIIGGRPSGFSVCTREVKLDEEFAKRFLAKRCEGCLSEFVLPYEKFCLTCFRCEFGRARQYRGLKWIATTYEDRYSWCERFHPERYALLKRKSLTRF